MWSPIAAVSLSQAQNIAFLVACLFCLLTSVLWYRLKFLLRARGYPMSYIRHVQDLTHLNQLIATSPPDIERLRLFRIWLYAAFFATLGTFVWFFILPFHHS